MISKREGLFFLLGVAAGAVAGVLSLQSRLEKQYQKKLEERVEEIENYYIRTEQPKQADAEPQEEEAPNEDATCEEGSARERGVLSQEERNLYRRAAQTRTDAVNYGGYYTGRNPKPPDVAFEDLDLEHPEDDDEEDPFLERAVELTEEHIKNRGRAPRIISYDVIGELGENYVERTLFFYMGSQELMTEEEELIEDPSRLVGDALEKYGFRNNEESCIYVQNFEFDTVYEIQKVWT